MTATIQKILKPSKYRAVDTSTSEQETYDIQTDGEFNGADDTNWQTGTAASISGGYAIVSDSGGNSGNVVQGFNAGGTKGAGARGIKQNDRYRVQMVVEDPDSGTFDGRVRVALYSESPGGVGGDNFKGFSSYLTSAGTLDEIVTVSQTNTGNYHDAIVLENTNDPCNFKIASIKVTKLEFFGNNNHGQIYSGRGLEFDGAVDYLTVPKGDASQPTDHLTIASWVYIDSTASSWQTIYASTAGWGEGIWCAFDGNENMVFDLHNVISYPNTRTSGGVIETNTWYRAVWTFTTDASTSFTIRMYLNGVLIKEVTEADGLHENIQSITQQNYDMMIGGARVSDPQYLLNGKLSDFQIWHKAWTQDEVTFDYLNPESLALNSGGSTLTESDLQIWYPMQDGHRGQQSYIMDGANTGLGNEQILNGDFSSFTTIDGTIGNSNVSGVLMTDWIHQGSTSGVGSGAYTVESHEGGVKVTTTTAPTSNWHHRLYQNLSLVENTHYKLSFELKSNVVGSILSKVMKGDSSNVETTSHTIVESDTWESKTCYFNCDFTDAEGIYFYKLAPTAGQYYAVRNVTIKPVNDKHHATTVFLGEELASEGDFENSGAAWSTSGSTITATKNTGAFVSTGDADGGFSKCLQDETLIEGRTYKLEFEVTAVTGSPSVHNYCGALTKSLGQASISTFTDTFVASSFDASTGGIEVRTICANGESVTIDNISFKEVGVASGWTDADQQLDIAQTALQSYNQLAWFDGKNDKAESTSFTPGAHTTVSFWVFDNYASGTSHPYLEAWSFGIGTGFRLIRNSADKFIVARMYGASSQETAVSTATVPIGEWVHIVAYIPESPANDLKIYINGEKDSTHNESQTMGLASQTIKIGISSGLTYNYFQGCITEIAVYSDELTLAEIQELYNDGKAKDATLVGDNLVRYFRNNGLATWIDRGSDGVNCTLSGDISETLLLPAGVDASRCTQGFSMNRQKTTNSLNFSDANGSQDVSVANEFVEIPRNSSIDNIWAGGGSISCWIKPSSDGENNGGRIFQKSTNNYIQASSESGGKLKLTMQVPFSSTNGIWTSNENNSGRVINIGEWNHIVITYNSDATSNDPIYYINNATEGHSEQTPVGSAITDNTANALIGNSSLSGLRQFDGQIDDMLIYSDILTADEVDRIYKAGKRSHR